MSNIVTLNHQEINTIAGGMWAFSSACKVLGGVLALGRYALEWHRYNTLPKYYFTPTGTILDNIHYLGLDDIINLNVIGKTMLTVALMAGGNVIGGMIGNSLFSPSKKQEA